MSKIEDFRKIAENYNKLADATGLYWRRLKKKGVSLETVEELAASEISLRNLSATASENAATLATAATSEQLKAVEEATQEGKDFLDGLETVKKGLKLVNGFLNLGIAAVSGNFESAKDSLSAIIKILSEDG